MTEIKTSKNRHDPENTLHVNLKLFSKFIQIANEPGRIEII